MKISGTVIDEATGNPVIQFEIGCKPGIVDTAGPSIWDTVEKMSATSFAYYPGIPEPFLLQSNEEGLFQFDCWLDSTSDVTVFVRTSDGRIGHQLIKAPRVGELREGVIVKVPSVVARS